jgi:hypothetical protein
MLAPPIKEVTSEEKDISQKDLERRKRRSAIEDEESPEFEAKDPTKGSLERPRDKGAEARGGKKKKNGDEKVGDSGSGTLGDPAKESTP